MSNERWQQEQEEKDQEICDALARTAVGLGGRREAEIFANALGQRFTDDRGRWNDSTGKGSHE